MLAAASVAVCSSEPGQLHAILLLPPGGRCCSEAESRTPFLVFLQLSTAGERRRLNKHAIPALECVRPCSQLGTRGCDLLPPSSARGRWATERWRHDGRPSDMRRITQFDKTERRTRPERRPGAAGQQRQAQRDRGRRAAASNSAAALTAHSIDFLMPSSLHCLLRSSTPASHSSFSAVPCR